VGGMLGSCGCWMLVLVQGVGYVPRHGQFGGLGLVIPLYCDSVIQGPTPILGEFVVVFDGFN
jgi:hypothetical protein